MKREDLVRFIRRRQRPQIVFVLIALLLFFLGAGLAMNGTLEKIDPRWSADVVVPTLAAIFIGIATLVATMSVVAVPKCPHCGKKFTAWFLNIAIASGNCGYCGKSIEDLPAK